jgi:hypothetical protein
MRQHQMVPGGVHGLVSDAEPDSLAMRNKNALKHARIACVNVAAMGSVTTTTGMEVSVTTQARPSAAAASSGAMRLAAAGARCVKLSQAPSATQAT